MNVQYEEHRGPRFQHTPENLANFFRPQPYFRNLSFQSGEDAVLCEAEVGLLLDAVLLALGCLPNVPTQGTLIIDGKKHGEGAECLVRANFAESAHLHTDQMVEESIDGILDNFQLAPDDGRIHHYHDNRHPKVLILGAAHGHFLATVKFAPALTGTSLHYGSITLLTIATTLALMRPDDAVIQATLENILKDCNRDATLDELKFIEQVKATLKAGKIPMANLWKTWLKTAGAENRPKEYFG